MMRQIIGGSQLMQGTQALKRLEENQPEGFRVGQEMQDVYNRAKQNADQGYRPAELSAIYRNRARTLNSLLQRGSAMGGGQASNALLSLGADATLNQDAQIAASDVALKRDALTFLRDNAMIFQNTQDANKQRELGQFDNAVAAASALANRGKQTMEDAMVAEQDAAMAFASQAYAGKMPGGGGGGTAGTPEYAVAPSNLMATVNFPQAPNYQQPSQGGDIYQSGYKKKQIMNNWNWE